MTGIDWSKAPAGTTHYGPPTEKYFGNWFQAHLCGWSIFYENRWLNVGEIQGERFDSLVPRPTQWGPYTTVEAAPAEWSGEGLPPVGTVCELSEAVLLADDEAATWFQPGTQVEVGGHAFFKGAEGSVCVICVTGNSSFTGTITELCLRPIRTAEQIAAEERSKAIFEMAGHSHVGCSGFAMDLCSALYDAGYRK